MGETELGAFRGELRSWLERHVPDDLRPENAARLPDEERLRQLRAWQHQLAGAHWVGITWPRAYGGRDAGMAFADKLRLSQLATSLGGTHTVVSHVASTTHRQLDDRALAAGGIDPGAVRFSIGLEDAEDLISDAYVALESLSRP